MGVAIPPAPAAAQVPNLGQDEGLAFRPRPASATESRESAPIALSALEQVVIEVVVAAFHRWRQRL